MYSIYVYILYSLFISLMNKVICFLIITLSLLFLWIILVPNYFNRDFNMHAFAQTQLLCSNGDLVSSPAECPPTDSCPSTVEIESGSIGHCSVAEISSAPRNYGPNSTTSPGGPSLNLKNDSLTIFTDKQIYKKGELVKITVGNNSTRNMKLFNTNSMTIRNLQTGEKYSPSSIPIRARLLFPGESVNFEWDQRYPVINSSKQVNSGNYTVSVFATPLVGNPMNASTIFTISTSTS